MKPIGISLLVMLVTLLAGCESRPAAQTAVAPVDSVALAAAVASARLFTAELAEARQAVLRQAVLPADTSAPLIPEPPKTKSLSHPAQLPPGFTRNHRYVGTLGGQPVVLELTGEPGDHYGDSYERPYLYAATTSRGVGRAT